MGQAARHVDRRLPELKPIMSVKIPDVTDLPLGWAYIHGRGVIWHITNDDSSVRGVLTLCGKTMNADGWTRGAWAVHKSCRKCRDTYRQRRTRELLGGPSA